jgi:hypothetical protein
VRQIKIPLETNDLLVAWDNHLPQETYHLSQEIFDLSPEIYQRSFRGRPSVSGAAKWDHKDTAGNLPEPIPRPKYDDDDDVLLF